ncbi:ubinuclein-2a isoform X2 [Gadus morhua]|uniref:ubinuclein-2a isoform X2 n=1 Tax=Gadus morhua TaxID=8049 RepID=UPI0011B3E984|nr:ubinuclein-2-like isoform X2 [Gadus morhua]
MAEPRKVQFVTLSTFAAGLATDSRKRRLEDAADINFDGDGEVDATATGADGGSGRFGKTGNRDATEAKKITVRLDLSLSEPNDQSSVEFNYGELIKNLQVKSKPPIEPPTPVIDPNDPFNDDETDRLKMESMAKKFENKYGNTGKKRKDRMQDLIDIGFGYDETDPFIDNSEAYDELVPASLTTKLGGFYINTGTLQFRAASESEGEEGNKLNDGTEQEIQRRKKTAGDVAEESKPRKNRVPKQGVMALGLHRPEKKKRKKLMKDSLCLAAMIRRFNREKDEMRKRNPSAHHTPPSAHPHPHLAAKPNHSLASAAAASANAAHLHGNAAPGDLSLADLTADPAVMSLLGSANEKELQDLLGDLDFGLLDAAPQHAGARENGLMGVGGSKAPAAGGGGLGAGPGRGLSGGGGVFSPPPLPEGLPAPLIKRIEDLRGASRQFDQEGRKKFFTLDMNNILLDIELQVQEQPPEVRSAIYSHMEAFVPCNKEALLKRLKKLTLNIQDDRLRTPLLKLKLAVCSVMPEQIARYNMDCMAKVAKQQSEEVERNGSEDEDEEKPGKRVMGPRKKFIWEDKLRNLLCSLVRVKLSCYELEKPSQLSVEDYLKAFMENEVKPLWPKGWMQARILLKESRTVHSHLTGNLVKRRVLSGPRAKAKEGLWIQNPAFPMTSAPGASTSLTPPAGRRPPMPPSAEPICLSDSLDEDLSAPTLDSISHALALLGGASKGLLGPLQLPASSYLPFSSSAAAAPQHSLVKMESAAPVGGPSSSSSAAAAHNPSSSSSTSSTGSSPSASALGRLQGGGASLPPKPGDGSYGAMKLPSGAPGQGQHQRLVAVATAAHGRPSVMMGGVNKLHPQPSPSPPKQRPPPTSSPLLPPHQKGYSGPAGPLGGAQGMAKSGAKPPAVSSSSNGGSMGGGGGGMLPPPRSSPLPLPRPTLQSYCPAVSSASSAHPPSPSLSSHSALAKPHPHPHPHPHPQPHQSNFITPMQATLTKSSHSSTSSSIIKLTPRPPGPSPAPPPSSSSSSSSSLSLSLSQPQILSAQQHQFSQKAQGFRPPYCLPAGVQAKLGQASYSFAGGQKTQAVSVSGGSITTASPSNKINNNNSMVAMTAGSIRPGNSPSPSSSSSSSSVSANHGQRQRTGGGAGQGSKAGNGRVVSGTPSPSHLAQVSSVAGGGLVGSPPTLPLGYGMLGGLVPVSLPFQFPSLLNFSAPPGVPGGLGGAPNSGFSLTQNELLELYKSLQSGSQAALPPHLQLAFSDANQNQASDMKRKSH